jgi:hypothetical protein
LCSSTQSFRLRNSTLPIIEDLSPIPFGQETIMSAKTSIAALVLMAISMNALVSSDATQETT